MKTTTGRVSPSASALKMLAGTSDSSHWPGSMASAGTGVPGTTPVSAWAAAAGAGHRSSSGGISTMPHSVLTT